MRILFLLLSLGIWTACGSGDQPIPPHPHPLPDSPPRQSLVPPPPSPDTLPLGMDSIAVDTTRKAEKPKRLPPKAQFETTSHRYGSIPQGKIVEYTYKLKNVGDLPLEIKDVRGSCGCTIGSYSFLPIRSGETSEIKARFDSKGKMGNQKSTLTVTTNGDPAVYTLTLEGVVTEAPKDSIR